MSDRADGDVGLLPAFAAGTLFVFYMVWAAMHDIAHGEADCTLEYAVLIASVPAFALLYCGAVRALERRAKTAWLAGTGLLTLVYSLGAVDAMLHPKYTLDPMLASLFLTAGVPALGCIAYHLLRARRSAS